MHPISELLCQVYAELHKNGQVKFPLHEKHDRKIDTIVKTVNANYFGFERYPTPIDKAVAYLCLIIKGHPVTDGNKRLAIFWFRVYCITMNIKADPSPYTLDQIAVAIEKNKDLTMERLMEIVKQLLFEK